MKWSSLANQHAMITVGNRKVSQINLDKISKITMPLYATHALLIGSIISFIEKFNLWPIGIYSFFLGIFLFIVEYPRGLKCENSMKQSSFARPYQLKLSVLFNKFNQYYSNFFARFVIYTALSIPCYFTLSTLIPAFNILITGLLYLFSNFKKEKWMMIEKKSVYTVGTFLKQPERPPPRTLNDI